MTRTDDGRRRRRLHSRSTERQEADDSAGIIELPRVPLAILRASGCRLAGSGLRVAAVASREKNRIKAKSNTAPSQAEGTERRSERLCRAVSLSNQRRNEGDTVVLPLFRDAAGNTVYKTDVRKLALKNVSPRLASPRRGFTFSRSASNSPLPAPTRSQSP